MRTYTKVLYLTTGFLLVGLAALGVVIPLLPTTPFLLLAAGCFAQSSERCHRWLLNHRIFGPVIQSWHENRCIPRRAKTFAIISILLFGGYAVGFAIESQTIRIIGGIFLAAGMVSVLRIPTCGNKN